MVTGEPTGRQVAWRTGEPVKVLHITGAQWSVNKRGANWLATISHTRLDSTRLDYLSRRLSICLSGWPNQSGELIPK